jgi:hypothetical protein
MPRLTGAWTETDGATIEVLVGLSGREIRLLRAAGSPVPQPVTLLALIDTGAQVSCVDPDAITRLPLAHYGFTQVNAPAVGGFGFAIQYAVSLTIPHPSGNAADNFHVTDLPLTEVPLGLFGCDVLLGRDVLARCVFRFDGPALAFILDY